MTQRLAIIGASVRAAAMSARRAGIEPVTADLFGDMDLRAICCSERIADYPHGLAAWLAKTSANAWLYTGGLENYPVLVDAMARRKPLYGNCGGVLRKVRSPNLLAEALRSKGLRFPETRRDAKGLPRDGSWLAKTGRGSSGLGVYGPGEDVHADAPFYQRRIDGKPGAAVFVASKGQSRLLGITRQLVGLTWTAARPFQYAGSIGPWPMNERAVAIIRKIGKTVSQEFNLLGLFGVDFILSENAVWTIEVNPRYTASVEIVERMTDVKTVAGHIAACRGRLPGIEIETFRSHVENTFYGKVILFARRDVVVPRAFTAWAVGSNSTPLIPKIADIPAEDTVITGGRPVATSFTEAASFHEVTERLQHQLVEMETKLYAG